MGFLKKIKLKLRYVQILSIKVFFNILPAIKTVSQFMGSRFLKVFFKVSGYNTKSSYQIFPFNLLSLLSYVSLFGVKYSYISFHFMHLSCVLRFPAKGQMLSEFKGRIFVYLFFSLFEFLCIYFFLFSFYVLYLQSC